MIVLCGCKSSRVILLGHYSASDRKRRQHEEGPPLTHFFSEKVGKGSLIIVCVWRILFIFTNVRGA